MPANNNYQPLKITSEVDFKVWGVVTFMIQRRTLEHNNLSQKSNRNSWHKSFKIDSHY